MHLNEWEADKSDVTPALQEMKTKDTEAPRK